MTDYYSLIPRFKKEIPNFLNNFKKIVLFEIDNDSESLGYRILENLKDDYNIFPISQETEILGQKCYANLTEIKEKIDASIIATDPKKTLNTCQKCFKNNVLNIWIEAGSESREALDFCKEKNINLIYLHSVLKEKINPSSKYKFKEES